MAPALVVVAEFFVCFGKAYLGSEYCAVQVRLTTSAEPRRFHVTGADGSSALFGGIPFTSDAQDQ